MPFYKTLRSLQHVAFVNVGVAFEILHFNSTFPSLIIWNETTKSRNMHVEYKQFAAFMGTT